jgi:rod shape-determining protein MreD
MRDATFMNEWILVALVLSGIFLAYRIGLVVTFTNLPSLGLHIVELVMTILFYPLAAAVSHWILGVRKLAPGDLDTLGGRT